MFKIIFNIKKLKKNKNNISYALKLIILVFKYIAYIKNNFFLQFYTSFFTLIQKLAHILIAYTLVLYIKLY